MNKKSPDRPGKIESDLYDPLVFVFKKSYNFSWLYTFQITHLK